MSAARQKVVYAKVGLVRWCCAEVRTWAVGIWVPDIALVVAESDYLDASGVSVDVGNRSEQG